ncbi:MAG: acetoacetate--CoA ligase, partial [Alphaproteobacteria bacterium]|nr:acetoacetate--CoA ligase [Alphaproteobacteria bacterium]
KPFPNMPVRFWNDDGAKKYRAAYFEKFPGVWCHGDWIEKTESGGYIIHGRSDATTKRQGIRIGTAEFYNIIEPLPEVDNSLVVGYQTADHDKIFVFVKLAQGYALDDDLKTKINTALRHQGSPRHVPDDIVAAPDIPVTRNAKKAEMAVLNIFHGKPVTNITALANPESLSFYEDFARTHLVVRKAG